MMPQLSAAKRIIIVACGTSWRTALVGEYLFEEFARIPVEVEYASEFRYRNPVINKGDVVIAISQSGETADTLAAIRMARAGGSDHWHLQRGRVVPSTRNPCRRLHPCGS